MYKILTYSLVVAFMLICISCQKDVSSENKSPKLPETVDFNFHVKPILSDRCFKCHGPDEKAREADLRLDIKESAFAALDSARKHFAIVPGDIERSELVYRISNTDPDEMMPPPKSNLQLSQYEIDLLKKWIEQGAEWKSHWAFTPPQKPDVPKISNKAQAKNPIDNFILSRLEQEGLKSNKEASKEKLIRRLSFDLRGLPPTLEEIDVFLADHSDDAYEKLVDQFLSEDAYGERMAMEWLDLARYADSHGYQDDLERSMWPWRDWVIDAFNGNMPYDQFVSWQLAGDLLPDATYEQKLATGFNRNHKITQEVGVVDEEYRVNYVLDRTNTFSTAFLGLTVECAQCHDHKYDPISQKEFYSLFSFFNQVPEKGRVDYGVEVAAPYLLLPEEKAEEITTYIHNLLETEKNRQKDYVQTHWKENYQPENIDIPSNSSPLPEGLKAWYSLDYIENNQTPEALDGKSVAITDGVVPVQGKFSGGMEFMGTNSASLQSTRVFDFNGPFSLSVWIKSLDGGIRGEVFASLSKARKNKKDNVLNVSLSITSAKTLSFYLGNSTNGTNIRIQSRELLPINEWANVTITHDGSRKSDGIHIYLDGKLIENPKIFEDKLLGTVKPSKLIHIGARYPEDLKKKEPVDELSFFFGTAKGLMAGQVDELMFFGRKLEESEIQDLINYNPISDLLLKESKNEDDLKRLFYHQLQHQDANYQLITQYLREYKIRVGRLADITLRPTMIMADMDTVRPTFVLDRGQYDAPTERVETGTPKAVLAFEHQYPKNRLGLSQWLFDEENPLTARVAANRYWQMIFGKGIVATPEDFGSQGALPTHPALLDWLAVEFQTSNWDVKNLIKLMVTSATYRQSTTSNSRLKQADPENILLARGPQVRLSAEMVRDHALAISGLMSPKIGGPSVKPYQPQGLWLQVASGNQSLRKYIQDHDQDLYRRSLYTFWKRTIPPPSMTVFDAPSREQCTIKRRTTSTPMQALVLLNDPQFIEASRLIATRMIREGGETAEERIRFAFRLATSREPNSKELKLLQKLLAQEKKDFVIEKTSAQALLNVGEYPIADKLDFSDLAAYTVVANAILNLTESIMKG